MIAAECVQIVIARDNGLGTGSQCAGKHRRVIGVAKLRLFDGCGLDGFGDLPIARDDLNGREVLLLEFGSELVYRFFKTFTSRH